METSRGYSGPMNTPSPTLSPVEESITRARDSVQTMRERLDSLRMQREQLDSAIGNIEKELSLVISPNMVKSAQGIR